MLYLYYNVNWYIEILYVIFFTLNLSNEDGGVGNTQTNVKSSIGLKHA